MLNPYEIILERIDQRFDQLKAMINDQKSQPQVEPVQEPKKLYGDAALAKHLGCAILTVANLRKNKAIPYKKIGRRYLYNSEEVDRALQVESRPRKFAVK